MTEENEKESVADYTSRRLVELKNSEKKYVERVTQCEIDLQRARADLIACRGRIDEISRIIQGRLFSSEKTLNK